MKTVTEIIKEQEQMLREICSNYRYIYIYGHGVRGKEQERLLFENGITVDGFVVTEGNDAETIEVSKLDSPVEETLVILALNEVFHDDVKQCLEKKGYHHIYNTGFLARMKNMVLTYTAKGIDFDSDTLSFNNVKLYNTLLDDKYRYDTMFELFDMIFPYLNDYSRMDEGPYETEKVYLEKGDTVIDCGANIGIFSAFAASRGCKVVAFEPTPQTWEALEENRKLYPGSIEIEPYALSDQEGKAQFFVYDSSSRNTLIRQMSSAYKSGEITVNLITLDKFVTENDIKVDFIKADIEGAERYMLMGAKETIQKYKPKIAICTYHLEDDKEVLENLLRSYVSEYHIEHRWKKLFAWVDER